MAIDVQHFTINLEKKTFHNIEEVLILNHHRQPFYIKENREENKPV